MTRAVLDLSCGQASIKGPTGVLDRPGLYIWDDGRHEMVWMPWADALRMALWILREDGSAGDLGARIAVLEDMGVWKEDDEDGEDRSREEEDEKGVHDRSRGDTGGHVRAGAPGGRGRRSAFRVVRHVRVLGGQQEDEQGHGAPHGPRPERLAGGVPLRGNGCESVLSAGGDPLTVTVEDDRLTLSVDRRQWWATREDECTVMELVDRMCDWLGARRG